MYSLSANTDTSGKTISWSVIERTTWDNNKVIAEFLYFDTAKAYMHKLDNQQIESTK